MSSSERENMYKIIVFITTYYNNGENFRFDDMREYEYESFADAIVKVFEEYRKGNYTKAENITEKEEIMLRAAAGLGKHYFRNKEK